MKRLLTIILTIACFNFSYAQDLNIADYEGTMDGECTADVLGIAHGVTVDRSSLNDSDLLFSLLAKRRAGNLYMIYFKNWSSSPIRMEDLNIRVEIKKSVKTGLPTSFDLGAIVRVDMGTDEDEVFFYFTKESDSTSNLKMALHSEQSSTSYWVCEY